jgi:peptidyl-tRNA hydrolase PTH2
LYVFVRRDLDWSQRLVQAGHAVANLVFQRHCDLDTVSWGDLGPAIIVYGLAGERELLELESRLGSRAVSFREPDLGDHLTAIAYLGPPLADLDRFTLL